MKKKLPAVQKSSIQSNISIDTNLTNTNTLADLSWAFL